jgi:hypothetical protein
MMRVMYVVARLSEKCSAIFKTSRQRCGGKVDIDVCCKKIIARLVADGTTAVCEYDHAIA